MAVVGLETVFLWINLPWSNLGEWSGRGKIYFNRTREPPPIHVLVFETDFLTRSFMIFAIH